MTKGAYTPTKEKRACNSHRAHCIHQNSNVEQYTIFSNRPTIRTYVRVYACDDPYPFVTIFSFEF